MKIGIGFNQSFPKQIRKWDRSILALSDTFSTRDLIMQNYLLILTEVKGDGGKMDSHLPPLKRSVKGSPFVSASLKVMTQNSEYPFSFENCLTKH